MQLGPNIAKSVQHEKSATRKKCNMRRVCNTKKQHKNSAAREKSNMKRV